MKRLLVCLLLVGVVGCGESEQVAQQPSGESEQAKELTLKGHSGWVNSVSFSPDGKRIVSGSVDKTLKVWDAETGQEVLTLNGHTQTVTSVSFSPNGRRIVSGSYDNTLKVWDARPLEKSPE